MKPGTRAAIEAALKAARDIAQTADEQDRDLTADERGQVSAHLSKAAELKKSAEDADELRRQLSDLSDGVGIVDSAAREKATTHNERRGTSIGKSFVDSDAYKGLVASVPNGRFSEKTRVQSAPYGVKALITGLADDSAGSLITPDTYGGIDNAGLNRPLSIRQLFTRGTTGTDTIEYVRQLAQTNNAAPVAEATTAALPTQDGTTGALINAAGGGYKPESAMTLERVSTTVRTIAHWIPATRRSLSDAAQIRTLIDSFLRYGLEEELEDQLLTGDGTGENLEGLDNVSGVQTEAAPGAGEDMFTVTRRGRRKVQVGGRATPTAYVMHPIDWENIELARDGNDRFFGNGPFSNSPNRLWGLPVIESEAVAQGYAWVADWRMAVIWDRQQAQISVTDSHADFFVRNLVAILAEMRVAFGVLRPAAFCKIDLVA